MWFSSLMSTSARVWRTCRKMESLLPGQKCNRNLVGILIAFIGFFLLWVPWGEGREKERNMTINNWVVSIVLDTSISDQIFIKLIVFPSVFFPSNYCLLWSIEQINFFSRFVSFYSLVNTVSLIGGNYFSFYKQQH